MGNGSVLDPAERAVIRIAGNGEGSCPLASLAQVSNTLYVLRADAGLGETPGTSAMREGRLILSRCGQAAELHLLALPW